MKFPKLLNFTIVITLIFCTTFTFGQTGTIQGKIIDGQNREELIGAAIKIVDTDFGAVSDIDGTFIITNVNPGSYSLTSTYFSYADKTIDNIKVKAGETTFMEIKLEIETVNIAEVQIIAKVNRESENVLLLEQKNAIVATQSIGAAELSRKGLGDAESAVASVSGVSKQEGVKNVFVRGLGDRYNTTLLNGLPVPSEDPEYKNIALSFFESDIIMNIGVDKVFPVHHTADAGGAIIDIKSKELNDDYALGLSISAGINNRAIMQDFVKTDGFNYFGYSKLNHPDAGKFNFKNSLDPVAVNLPMNQSFKLSGGKRMTLADNPLSFYGVITQSSEYTYTEEIVRNTTTDGTIYQDQEGKKYSGKKSQLALANVNYKLNNKHSIAYNFMMLHATNHYIGEYQGKHAEKYQDSPNDFGYLRRQQINDNRLTIHQLISTWKLSEKWDVDINTAMNQITGYEPDRRENYLSQKAEGTYGLTGSNRQKRFFSELDGADYNTKVVLNYKLNDALASNRSKISLGYNNHISNTDFEAIEYNFSAISGNLLPDQLMLDNLYNTENFDNNQFTISESYPSSYNVSKNNHAVFVNGAYQLSKTLSGTLGLKYDFVNMDIRYNVPGRTGNNKIHTAFLLPSLNLKYDATSNSIFRLGASKTYTLPQSKEISPFQYVNIGFASEGNPNLRHSENYNVDVKWDYFLSPSEIISAGVFYKHILNPIGRVDKGNSAGLLTYDNIGKSAVVKGFEIEIRKDIFRKIFDELSSENKLSAGVNFSYILTSSLLNIENTAERMSNLEGASPFIINSDITYRINTDKRKITTSLVFNYFSDRIYTIGTLGYNDIIEKAVPTIDFVFSTQLRKKTSLKFKAANLLDPSFKLTRKVAGTDEVVLLNEYHKGINVSLGLSFDL